MLTEVRDLGIITTILPFIKHIGGTLIQLDGSESAGLSTFGMLRLMVMNYNTFTLFFIHNLQVYSTKIVLHI